MTTTTSLHPLAADYLDRLEHAARHLPRAERRDLVEEIGAHLSEATDPDMSDAEALTVLDRLGDPEDIVEAQRPDAPAPADRRGIHEWAAIFLVLFGGFAFAFGWVIGLILLWSSRAWNTRDKLIGTFLVPGGLAGGVYALLFLFASAGQVCTGTRNGGEHCTGGPSTLGLIATLAGLAFLLLAPIATSIYLARRAR
jgi:hypothetical protein